MKIGNILTSEKIEVPEEFNVAKTESELIEGLPTLYVGYNYVDKHFPNFDITDKSLGNDKYWTFKRSEKRDYYEDMLQWFISKAYHKYVDDVIYLYVDPINYRGKTFRKIIRKILSTNNIITYSVDDMVYMYGDKYIFGVNLKVLKYMGLDIDKLKNKIKSISTVFLEGFDILIEYKKSISFLNSKLKYIPIFYSIRNGKENIAGFVHIP